MQTDDITKLKITGITCEGCNVYVRQALESVPGVRMVTVHAGSATALVVHEDAPAQALIEALRATGYGAAVLWENDGAEEA